MATDANSGKFKSVLERTSAGLMTSALIEEAVKIHNAHDIRAAEQRIAMAHHLNRMPYAIIHSAFVAALNSTEAREDQHFAAELYRDIAILNQGIASAKQQGPDMLGARIMLTDYGVFTDPYNARNAIDTARRLAPDNKDLPQLITIQDELESFTPNRELHHAASEVIC